MTAHTRLHAAPGVLLTALSTLLPTGAQAYEIEAYARTTVSAFFSTTVSDVQTSSTLISVSAAQSGPNPSFGQFSSHSTAGLAPGTLRGYSSVRNTNAQMVPGLVTESTARIDETLSFVPPPLPVPPTIPVIYVLHVHGSFSSLSGVANAYGLFSLSGNGSGDYFTVSCDAACSSVQVSFSPHVSVISSAPGSWAVDLSQTFVVDPTLPFQFHSNMSTQASSYGAGSATLDASNTASIQMILPAGYSFTSRCIPQRGAGTRRGAALRRRTGGHCADAAPLQRRLSKRLQPSVSGAASALHSAALAGGSKANSPGYGTMRERCRLHAHALSHTK